MSPRKSKNLAKASLLGRMLTNLGSKRKDKQQRSKKKPTTKSDKEWVDEASGPLTGAAGAIEAVVERVVASMSSRQENKKKRGRRSDESGRTAAMRRSLGGDSTVATPGSVKNHGMPSSGSVRRVGTSPYSRFSLTPPNLNLLNPFLLSLLSFPHTPPRRPLLLRVEEARPRHSPFPPSLRQAPFLRFRSKAHQPWSTDFEE